MVPLTELGATPLTDSAKPLVCTMLAKFAGSSKPTSVHVENDEPLDLFTILWMPTKYSGLSVRLVVTSSFFISTPAWSACSVESTKERRLVLSGLSSATLSPRATMASNCACERTN
jgi:hypothetical protein